ncbi:MAG: mismatch repair protein MutL [Thermomicrobiales bacterium]|jgi:DNA mismatch repair protein MutL|nr:mismatch repair protein MutL [Thermomicrobiales bacterium]
MSIRLLANDTIGKIAAGEVVERPASAAKELLENALDAGATRVQVEIAGGGIDLIEVADDGCGIPLGELPLAVQRHATSKLATFEDLDRLKTLGFRGEALPSIGAVSSLTIRTRERDAASGAVMQVEFGETRGPRPVAAPVGTTVTVRDLFGNVPARRKFLRQPGTESGYIARAAEAYAAAYPAVAFSFTVDGRRAFSTDGSGDPIAAAAGAFGLEVGEAAILLEPLEESAAVSGVTVRGWIGAPNVTRSHRQGLVFFVNGRWIQNRALSFALEEAYHSLLMVGRHPVALVQIEVEPTAVDVNVHPTKAEVKFVDERAVCRAVQRSAHAALARSPRDELPRVTLLPVVPAERQAVMPIAPVSDEVPKSEPAENGMAKGVEAHPSGLPILRVLGQVAAMYIIAEGPEGLYLIDQHAAHERVMYEKILGQMASQGVDRQPLLDALVVDLAPEELAVFEKSEEELRQIGFEAEVFGEGAAVIRSVPAIVRGVDLTERFKLILRELAEGGVGTSWLDSVAISAACHTSIRAGQSLSLPEMRELVAQLERTRHPRACGHGRPTMLHLTQGELERQFSRR